MANPHYYPDDMDSCRVHGVAAMRHTPVDGETPQNLDHWACSQCGFKPSDIDWVAEIRKEPDHEELGGVPGRRLTEDEWEYLYDEAKVVRKEAEIARKREEQG